MSDTLKLGHIIEGEANRDATHVAVAPVIAGERLLPGEHVAIDADGMAINPVRSDAIGVVDPFLKSFVRPGQKFWLFLYPGTITALRHEWTHPAFALQQAVEVPKSDSEKWMTRWAMEHMGEDYYGDGHTHSPQEALGLAIRAGHNLSVGPYESARDHIDNDWWTHWENITGQKGERGEYFSCGC